MFWRPWPRCGGAYTVGPHRYIDTEPGSRRASSRTSLVAVSYSRSTTVNARWAARDRRGWVPVNPKVPVSWSDGPDPGQTDAGRDRGPVDGALGGRRPLPLRPDRRAGRRVLDRHAATDGV